MVMDRLYTRLTWVTSGGCSSAFQAVAAIQQRCGDQHARRPDQIHGDGSPARLWHGLLRVAAGAPGGNWRPTADEPGRLQSSYTIEATKSGVLNVHPSADRRELQIGRASCRERV